MLVAHDDHIAGIAHCLRALVDQVVAVAVDEDDVAGPCEVAFMELDEGIDIGYALSVVVVDLVLVIEESSELDI